MYPVTWLRPNRRVLLATSVPLLLAGLTGAWLLQVFGLQSVPTLLANSWFRWGGGAVAAFAALALTLLAWQANRPRLACGNGELLVYLRAAGPIRVPLDAVECFLLGQGATLLEDHRLPSRTVTLLIRLAEKRTEWSHIEVHRLLGAWCGGQITIRGTWCEPLNLTLVNSLNERLAIAQQELAKRSNERVGSVPAL